MAIFPVIQTDYINYLLIVTSTINLESLMLKLEQTKCISLANYAGSHNIKRNKI